MTIIAQRLLLADRSESSTGPFTYLHLDGQNFRTAYQSKDLTTATDSENFNSDCFTFSLLFKCMVKGYFHDGLPVFSPWKPVYHAIQKRRTFSF
jgi:hypothetical protein